MLDALMTITHPVHWLSPSEERSTGDREIQVHCLVHNSCWIVRLWSRLHETHTDLTSLEQAWHPDYPSSVLLFTVTDHQHEEQNLPWNCSCTHCNQVLSCCRYGQRWRDRLELRTDCWDARRLLHKAAGEAPSFEAVSCDGNNRNWTRESPCKWAQYGQKLSRNWSRKWSQNWDCKWDSECRRKVNWLGMFFLSGSTMFDWLLFSCIECYVWNRHDSHPGGVLSWLGVRIALCQGPWWNLPLLYLVPLVIDQHYVSARCLITQYNRHTFAYARTHSTTWAGAPVQHSPGGIGVQLLSAWYDEDDIILGHVPSEPWDVFESNNCIKSKIIDPSGRNLRGIGRDTLHFLWKHTGSRTMPDDVRWWTIQYVRRQRQSVALEEALPEDQVI